MNPMLEARIAFIKEMGLVAHLLPAAQHASQLRGAGIRLSMDALTREAFEALAAAGDTDAAFVAANAFPTGHPEIATVR